MIEIYTEFNQGRKWLQKYRGCPPVFVCILGFTATCLIPGISAAGATPTARRYTAIADAEFLLNGPQSQPHYPLPPLEIGVSPAFISRAAIAALNFPVYLLNAGLPLPPAVPTIDLKGIPANCLSTGKALPLAVASHLLSAGWQWGEKLARESSDRYLIVGECVVGGTTTALAVLTGLGIPAAGKVNSSHLRCNHQQKWTLVQAGLASCGLLPVTSPIDPLVLVAAVGDPMQLVAAGMALAASRTTGVILAGGTQMLAVYALMRAINSSSAYQGNLDRVVVGTTRWVVEDPTGDTVGLARAIEGLPLLAAQLSFTNSQYPQLQAYEQGYVKEGVGAGGCAIAAHLYQGWTSADLLRVIEALMQQSGFSFLSS